MHQTKVPLQAWFHAADLFSSYLPKKSDLQRALGLNIKTASRMWRLIASVLAMTGELDAYGGGTLKSRVRGEFGPLDILLAPYGLLKVQAEKQARARQERTATFCTGELCEGMMPGVLLGGFDAGLGFTEMKRNADAMFPCIGNEEPTWPMFSDSLKQATMPPVTTQISPTFERRRARRKKDGSPD